MQATRSSLLTSSTPLIGAGSAEGTLDAANILKPALSRGEMQCIGATTPAEFRKSIEKDRALERRFQAIRISAPTEEEAIEIVKGVAERYEAFHQVRYSDEALEAAVLQSNRFISKGFCRIKRSMFLTKPAHEQSSRH
jgi:ATP-dependent Clp protease ATP-binding subunit ClpC